MEDLLKPLRKQKDTQKEIKFPVNNIAKFIAPFVAFPRFATSKLRNAGCFSLLSHSQDYVFYV